MSGDRCFGVTKKYRRFCYEKILKIGDRNELRIKQLSSNFLLISI